jgi:hypothetical protein
MTGKEISETIRRVYPRWGAEGVRMECPHLTLKAIQNRASDLKVRRVFGYQPRRAPPSMALPAEEVAMRAWRGPVEPQLQGRAW